MRQQVAEALEAEEISQSELARRAEISRPNLVNWLAGNLDIKLSTLEKICAALGREIQLTPPRRSNRSTR